MSKYFWFNLLPIFVSFLFIAIEYFLIYKYSYKSVDNASITISFFKFYYAWGGASNILEAGVLFVSSIFSSFLFPIVLLAKNKHLFRSRMIQFALFSMILGILISVTFIETGERLSHGNFLWQNYMISFLLFFACTLELIKMIEKNKFNNYKMELISLMLHFFALVYYFFKTYQTQVYY